MKEGKIIKSTQGRFAKVISVKGNRFGLSAWVNKEKMAEDETVIVKFLNSFGMAQVLGTEATGDATVSETVDEPETKTKKKDK